MADSTKTNIETWVHNVIHRAAQRGEIDTGYFTSQRKLLELKKRFEHGSPASSREHIPVSRRFYA